MNKNKIEESVLPLFAGMIERIPYAKWIGMQIKVVNNGVFFHLPFQPSNIGNALIPALHGGLIGGFLETSAILYLMWSCKTDVLPRIVDFSIDYLRTGKPEDVWAECDIVRQGSRIANIEMRAWQADSSQPIVAARAHFLLV